MANDSHATCSQKEATARYFWMIIGGFIHTMIALTTYNHTKNSTLGDFIKLERDVYFDLMVDILYCVVIDASFGILLFNRSGVRIWHWKINATITAILLIWYFSNNKLFHFIIFLIILSSVYYSLNKCEKAIYKVGLSKYLKKKEFDPDYYDVGISRNLQYVLVTLTEAFFIYNHLLWFFSPLLFVVGDALVHRIAKRPRTKISDLYAPIFNLSQDTGLWMALFNAKSVHNIWVDISALIIYLIFVELIVFIDTLVNTKNLLQQCQSILNNEKKRWISLVLWTLFSSLLTGEYKHVFSIYVSNIIANSMFMYLAADITLQVDWKDIKW